MKTRRKSLFSAFLSGVFASALLFVAIFSGQIYAAINIIDDNVVAIRGWDMASCRIPMGPNSTQAIYFRGSDIINMPLHINKQNDSPDIADIFIAGNPTFLQPVKMGESQYTSGSSDKYASYMSLFQNGIYFDVPDSKIGDAAAVQNTIDRFRDSTLPAYIFTPNLSRLPTTNPFNTTSKCAAVQLEFLVLGGIGYVRITNNCAVALTNPGALDYNIVTASNPMSFHQYKIYGYHYRPNGVANQTIVPITNTYVTQTIGNYTSDPGGQIFVNGNVIIGGDSNSSTDPNQVVQGKITVVATGNIWIADSIRVDGTHDTSIDPNGIPAVDNPNFLGLISQGVIKIVDPGQLTSSPANVTGYIYQPIGIKKSASDPGYIRYMPDPTIVEASITVAGGGWGAENVDSSGGRRMYSGSSDTLVLHGAISEVVRGVVNIGDPIVDGYAKQYYYDSRLLPVLPVCSAPILGDLNGDCVVDFEDVAIMALHWLESNLSADDPPICTSPIEGDVTNDCSIDFLDLAIMASHWLECNLSPL